jgi:hypothetical protein
MEREERDKEIAFAFLEFVIASIKISNGRTSTVDFYWDHFKITDVYKNIK